MKEVGASKRLGHLIEGESLLNDGSAYVFFLIFFDMYTGVERSNGEIVGYFLRLIAVAAAVGIAFGLALTCFLAIVYRCAPALAALLLSMLLLLLSVSVLPCMLRKPNMQCSPPVGQAMEAHQPHLIGPRQHRQGQAPALACRDRVVEITATITAAFLCFWVAEETCGVSGVLAVVTLAVFMAALGKYAVSPSVTACPLRLGLAVVCQENARKY